MRIHCFTQDHVLTKSVFRKVTRGSVEDEVGRGEIASSLVTVKEMC